MNEHNIITLLIALLIASSTVNLVQWLKADMARDRRIERVKKCLWFRVKKEYEELFNKK